MRVAIVDVRAAAIRGIVAEASGRGLRRVMDRAVAVGLAPVLGGPPGTVAASGTVDILRETARRFQDAHARLGVDRTVLSIDGELRGALAAVGLDTDLARVLDAQLGDGDVAAEARDLVRSAVHHRVLDERPALVVELGRHVARVVRVDLGEVRSAVRLPVRDAADLASLVRSDGPSAWLDTAVAAASPLLDAAASPRLPAPARIVVAGGPVQALARAVAGRDWRRPLRAVDRVRVTASTVLALTSELRGVPPGHPRAGLDASEVQDATGTAVLLAGMLAVTGAPMVLTTDAERVEGRLLDLLEVTCPAVLSTRILEAAGAPTPHAVHVARLATALFDGCATVAGLAPGDRDVLEAAALVHDLTRAEGPGHHRRAAERVLGLAVRGVEPGRLVEVTAIVRAQRGRPPGSHVPGFLRLPPARRDVVRRLVGLLRVADGLDRGDHGAVQDLLVRVQDPPGTGGAGVEAPVVWVDVVGDRLDLALYGARGHARHAEQALGVRLVLRPAARSVAAP